MNPTIVIFHPPKFLPPPSLSFNGEIEEILRLSFNGEFKEVLRLINEGADLAKYLPRVFGHLEGEAPDFGPF